MRYNLPDQIPGFLPRVRYLLLNLGMRQGGRRQATNQEVHQEASQEGLLAMRQEVHPVIHQVVLLAMRQRIPQTINKLCKRMPSNKAMRPTQRQPPTIKETLRLSGKEKGPQLRKARVERRAALARVLDSSCLYCEHDCFIVRRPENAERAVVQMLLILPAETRALPYPTTLLQTEIRAVNYQTTLTQAS